MSENDVRRFWCLVDNEETAFFVDASLTWNVGELTKAIQQARHRLLTIDIVDIVLWKLNDPIPVDNNDNDDTLPQRLPKPITDFSVKLGKYTQKLSVLLSDLPEDHLHLIVELSAAEPPLKKLKLKGEREEDRIYASYVQRESTVSALYDKLEMQRWVHVRGTPGSGKSVLAGLLRRYIINKEPNTEVVFHDVWPENQPVQTIPNTILILDEAQTTYWDKSFWSKFKNPELQGMRVVAFASHGSSGYTAADETTPMWIGMEQRVGLVRLDCGDGILVGLLFSREEFNSLVRLKFSNNRFSSCFLDCVFDMTNGHVGAFQDLMKTVIAHKSYRERGVKSAEYTYEMFISGVPMVAIPQAMYSGTVFGRGLPQAEVLHDNPHITAMLGEAIRNESVVCEIDYLASNPNIDDNRKAALRRIFRSGWLHTEVRPDKISYTFASPLHRRCIDWKLNGSPVESRIVEPNLLEFSLAVIKRFSPQSLEKRKIGPMTQSIPEAQFQDEFYSASSKQANGCVSFPEFGTKNGRIDFFIQSKKWGVELLRDGNRLGQHIERFTEGDYGKWIEKGWMSDYIIIDFRTHLPKNLRQDVDKLIYVVSLDGWNNIQVFDNRRKVIRQFCLLNSEDTSESPAKLPVQW